MGRHKSSAWPLGGVYAGLIVYASLYPFTGWRDQGPWPWTFLWAPWPPYWTAFDLWANVLGYAPLGFLLALGALRSGRGRWAVAAATLGASLLALLLETLQSYLPSRVPSNVDWALNTLGAGAGAVLAAVLERRGAIDRWVRFRARWFVPQARGALVLMALWPLALLYPAPVPLGLGQVFERLEAAVAELLQDTPWLDWLPVRQLELQPLLPAVEQLCVLLGALIPVLLGYTVILDRLRRLAYLMAVLLVGIGASALAHALSYGPAHAWGWLQPGVLLALALAAGLALLLVRVPAAYATALLLLALGVDLTLINQAPSSVYYMLTLQNWEQGRFIRFHGMAQWLAWIWPYAVLVYALQRLGRAQRLPTIGA
jgi:VanZ family protein